MIDDEEFDRLVEAFSARPGSAAIEAALIEAADSSLRKTVLKALGIHSGPAQAVTATEDSDTFPTLGVNASAATAPDDSNIVPLSSARPAPRTPSGPGLEDVGGLMNVKRQLHRKLLDPLKNPGLFQKFKRRTGGGLLLYGPPGCGKTMVVRAVAQEAGLHLVTVEAAEILDFAVGVSERKLTAAFDEARQRKPAVLFFDEVEALAGRRSLGTDFKAGLVSTFLSAFDGLAAQNDGILVIGATNTPWAVDSAFRRPGRFDRTLFVPPPDREARLAILRSLIAERPVAPSIDLQELARQTSGFSGADLTHLVETATDNAIEDCMHSGADEVVETKHFLDALDEVTPSVAEWLGTARNYAKYANEGGTYKEVLDFLDAHAA